MIYTPVGDPASIHGKAVILAETASIVPGVGYFLPKFARSFHRSTTTRSHGRIIRTRTIHILTHTHHQYVQRKESAGRKLWRAKDSMYDNETEVFASFLTTYDIEPSCHTPDRERTTQGIYAEWPAACKTCATRKPPDSSIRRGSMFQNMRNPEPHRFLLSAVAR